MTPRQPYLIRALYDWILDNDATPYILVRVDDRTSVPSDFVRDGQIVLNISPTAVRDLAIDDDWLVFDGRFSGHSVSVAVPVNCVCAIYARETGEGMIFDGDLKDGGDAAERPPASPVRTGDAAMTDSEAGGDDGSGGASRRGSHLRVVK
ncbi:MAG: ClpXP protease specificity-enhancing factor [Pseudomonadota bacterium]